MSEFDPIWRVRAIPKDHSERAHAGLEITKGDWVETDRGEVGEVTDLYRCKSGAWIAEVCVGRCYREMQFECILKAYPFSK